MPTTAADPAPSRGVNQGRGRALGRRVAQIACASVALLALVGLGHTRAARPLIAWMGGSAPGCPVREIDPVKLEAARVASLAPLRGKDLAPVRPALQFVLRTSTRRDVVIWARASHVPCGDEMNGGALRCRDVPATATGAQIGASDVNDLFFRFDPAGSLVSVDAMHAGVSGEAASTYLDTVSVALSKDLGPADKPMGEHSARYLSGDLYAQSSTQFRFRDYAADVSATNFGDRGVVVREQYRPIP